MKLFKSGNREAQNQGNAMGLRVLRNKIINNLDPFHRSKVVSLSFYFFLCKVLYFLVYLFIYFLDSFLSQYETDVRDFIMSK